MPLISSPVTILEGRFSQGQGAQVTQDFADYCRKAIRLATASACYAIGSALRIKNTGTRIA